MRFAFLLLLPGLAHGAETWALPLFTAAPEAALKAAADRKAPEGADVIVVSLEASVRFTADGRVRIEKRSVTRVLTDAGVKKVATISLPWSPWRQDRPKVRYRVITADGRARFLEESTITEAGVPARAVAGLFSDRKILNAPLPAVAAGSIIERETIVEDRQALLPGGQYVVLGIADTSDVQSLRVTVEVPKEMRLMVASRRFKPERTDETDPSGIRRVTLTADHVVASSVRSMMPPEAFPATAVEISAGATWKGIASWYGGIVDKLAGPLPSTAREPADSATEIAAALDSIHQKVRYTGLELGMSSYVPHTPEETLDRGYGDCKDQSVLLVRELRKAGFHASLALLTPYPGADARTGTAGMEAFTHAIVYVAGAQPVWIDPSARYSVATRLPSADQGRHAFIIDRSSTGLVVTPEITIADNMTTEEVEIVLAGDGKGRMKRHAVIHGALADTLRTVLTETATREMMQKTVRAEAGPSAKLEVGPPADATFIVTLSSDAYPHAETSGGTASAAISQLDIDGGPLSGLLIESIIHSGEARSDDFFLSSTFQTERKTRIRPPAGYVAKKLPLFTDMRMGPLTIERHADLDRDGSIRLFERLYCPQRRFSVKDGLAIARMMTTLSKAPRVKFEFEKQ